MNAAISFNQQDVFLLRARECTGQIRSNRALAFLRNGARNKHFLERMPTPDIFQSQVEEPECFSCWTI